MTDVQAAQKQRARAWRLNTPGILLLGAVIVPSLLTIITNSYGEPDAAAYVRMAFGSVAGATIAIVTLVGLLVLRIVRGADRKMTVFYAVLALAGVWFELNVISLTADLLVQRL